MVSVEQKSEVPSDFDKVAGSYDFFTALNPGYRKHLEWSAKRLELSPTAKILDLCCGTGLSTQAIFAMYPKASITGLDASAGMLAVAKKKLFALHVNWVLGDAMDPAAVGVTGPFDGILMAYGIRNVPDADLCLQRLHGLLAPGGKICFHEYSVKDSVKSRAVWNVVTNGIIIPGGIFSGGTKIYKYLRDSVKGFDGVRAFEQRLLRAGFVNVRTESMDGWQKGIVHSFIAERAK